MKKRLTMGEKCSKIVLMGFYLFDSMEHRRLFPQIYFGMGESVELHEQRRKH